MLKKLFMRKMCAVMFGCVSIYTLDVAAEAVCSLDSFSEQLQNALSRKVDLSNEVMPATARVQVPGSWSYYYPNPNETVEEGRRLLREAELYNKKDVDHYRQAYANRLRLRGEMYVARGDFTSGIADARAAAKEFDQIAKGKKLRADADGTFDSSPREAYNAIYAHLKAGDIAKAANYVDDRSLSLYAQHIDNFGLPTRQYRDIKDPHEAMSHLWTVYNTRRLQAELFERAATRLGINTKTNAQSARANAEWARNEMEKLRVRLGR